MGFVASVAAVAPFAGNGGGAFEVVGRAPAGHRCYFCGESSGVHLVRRRGGREVDQAHLGCAEKAWSDPQPPVTAALPEPWLTKARVRDLARWYVDEAADQQARNARVEVDFGLARRRAAAGAGRGGAARAARAGVRAGDGRGVSRLTGARRHRA